jgi:hypothetical protein
MPRFAWRNGSLVQRRVYIRTRAWCSRALLRLPAPSKHTLVSANQVVTLLPVVSADATEPFATADQPAGAVSVTHRALRSGWSKRGKGWFASAGPAGV